MLLRDSSLLPLAELLLKSFFVVIEEASCGKYFLSIPVEGFGRLDPLKLWLMRWGDVRLNLRSTEVVLSERSVPTEDLTRVVLMNVR